MPERTAPGHPFSPGLESSVLKTECPPARAAARPQQAERLVSNGGRSREPVISDADALVDVPEHTLGFSPRPPSLFEAWKFGHFQPGGAYLCRNLCRRLRRLFQTLTGATTSPLSFPEESFPDHTPSGPA